MSEKPCPWCGSPRERDSDLLLATCPAMRCREASARVALAEISSRGVPLISRGRITQPESERARKQIKLRMRPEAIARVRAYAASQRVNVCDLVERWALTLPEPSAPKR